MDFDLSGVMGGVSSGLGIIEKLIWIGAFCAIAYMLWFYMQFKHIAVIKKLGNTSKSPKLDKFREFRDKEGVNWYQIWSNKRKIAEIPAICTEIGNKGKKWIYLYETETGEYQPGIDMAQLREVPNDIKAIPDITKREEKIAEWKKANFILSSYQPYTAKQRMVLVSQHNKALEKRKKDWKEMVVPSVALISMSLIIVSMMVFAGEVIKPMMEYSDKMIAASKENQQMLVESRQFLAEVRAAKGCSPIAQVSSPPPN